jgi:S1-C subfamily serine protease
VHRLGGPALRLGSVPRLQEAVSLLGYPTGGDSLSVTSGVVSRVEMREYAHGAAQLLAVQVDAAVNPGNSGGPAIRGPAVPSGPSGAGPDFGTEPASSSSSPPGDNNDEATCAGIAFMRAYNADEGVEGMGFVIPTPVIRHFLEDVERGRTSSAIESGSGSVRHVPYAYTGFPVIGVVCQPIENPALRAYLSLDTVPLGAESSPESGLGGVYVSEVFPTSDAAGKVLRGDVMVSFDGVPIAADGTVTYRDSERVTLDYVVTTRHAGDTVTLGLIRDGARLDVDVVVGPLEPLVPIHWHGSARPSYLVHGGVVMTVLTQPLLHEFGENWYDDAPRRLTHLSSEGRRAHADEEVIVISQVLLDEVNVGYQTLVDLRVHAVNGEPVRNLAAVRLALDAAAHRGDRFTRIELDEGAIMVLDRTDAERAAPRIRERYGIPVDYRNARD